MTLRLHGLIAATHTPFTSDGALNLPAVERQAEHLLRDGIRIVFIGGSTGESHSLTFAERRDLTQRWTEVARGTDLRVVVHVGSNCLEDARALAAHAQQAGAAAVAALAPSYFKPGSIDMLVRCCAHIAGGAPELPFYYYDIPSMTGVSLPAPAFLEAAADRIPTLAGLKFTNPDLMAYQQCLACLDGRFDVPWGVDEYSLAALALGAKGAVGSTYNFAAPLYHRMWDAFARGDLAGARVEQFRSVQLIRCLAGFGYMGAAKALMGMLGVDVGPARLPNTNPSPDDLTRLRGELEAIGFFDWGRSR
jgi:N-acetylneuraminate lyase